MRTTLLSKILLLLPVVAIGTTAHMAPTMNNRSPNEVSGMRTVKRADPSRTDEASAATIKNEAQECQYYSTPGLEKLEKNYPKAGHTAKILPSDKDAQNIWAEIQKSGIIPNNIHPKGTPEDTSEAAESYDKSDPDCWWTASGCTKPKHDKIPADVSECPEPRTWGLTYDDGPNCSHNAFYDFLKQHNQKATMFYIGTNVLSWPLEAQRGLVDGHHICGHTWSHKYMTALSSESVFAELYYTGKAIKDIVGVTPRCWRPPYGDVDDRVRAIATGLGMETYLWADDTDDWNVQPAGSEPKSKIDQNYNKIMNKDFSTHGTIVLTHEINGQTMNEAQEMLPQIWKKFDHTTPLTACLNQTKPYPEDITYPNFDDYVAGHIDPEGVPSSDKLDISSKNYDPVGTASQPRQADKGSGNNAPPNNKSSSNNNPSESKSEESSSISLTLQSSGMSNIFLGLGILISSSSLLILA